MTWEGIIGPFQGATGKSVAETASRTTNNHLRSETSVRLPELPSPQPETTVKREQQPCRGLRAEHALASASASARGGGDVLSPSGYPGSGGRRAGCKDAETKTLPPRPPHMLVCRHTDDHMGSTRPSRSWSRRLALYPHLAVKQTPGQHWSRRTAFLRPAPPGKAGTPPTPPLSTVAPAISTATAQV